MRIRQATTADFGTIMALIDDGRASLAALGIDQWQGGSPNEQDITSDLAHGYSYLVENEQGVVGTMAYVCTGEADYDNVIEGAWLLDLDNTPADGAGTYATIHRVAVSSTIKSKGVASFMLQEAWRMASEQGLRSVRIDTHAGNGIMQHVCEKNGFTHCCDITITAPLEPTKLRLGYERICVDVCN